ncbi:MAG: biotin--[acetyl-CoA-carboxylase] ligase [Pseudomonadota bacterium]
MRDEDTVIRLGDVGSTNDEAMAHLRAGEGPFWLTAERQLAGRGRRGRAWVSEAGNLYATFAFSGHFAPEAFGILPLGAAVALADALCANGFDPALKWPNDVLIDGKKCAGILIETSVQGRSASRSTVIGYGVNVAHHPPDAPATHLAAHRTHVTKDGIFAALRPAVAAVLAVLQDTVGPRNIRQRWLQRAVGLGEPVTVRYDRGTAHGRFLGLDPEGRLILEEEGGATRLVAAGDVFVRTEPL